MQDSAEVMCECKKHGYVPHIKFRFFMHECECYLCKECEKENEELAKKEREKEAAQREKMQADILIARGIMPEYHKKDFCDYEANTAGQQKAIRAAKNLYEHKRGAVILLSSGRGENPFGYGTGKTMLASILAQKLKGKVITCFKLSVLIRKSYRNNSVKSEDEILEELCTTPFLAIDEVAKSKMSTAETNWFFHIIDFRHTAGLPYMIISNKHPITKCTEGGCENCFETSLAGDVLSRFSKDARVIAMDCKDYRK